MHLLPRKRTTVLRNSPGVGDCGQIEMSIARRSVSGPIFRLRIRGLLGANELENFLSIALDYFKRITYPVRHLSDLSFDLAGCKSTVKDLILKVLEVPEFSPKNLRWVGLIARPPKRPLGLRSALPGRIKATARRRRLQGRRPFGTPGLSRRHED
jgi:hypothetical protein